MFPYEAMRRIAAVWRTGILSNFKTSPSVYHSREYTSNRDLVLTNGAPVLGITPEDVYTNFATTTNAVRIEYLESFAIDIQPKTQEEFFIDYSTPHISTSTKKREELLLNIGDVFLYRQRSGGSGGFDLSFGAVYTKSHDQLRRSWNNWRYRITSINSGGFEITNHEIATHTRTIIRNGITGEVESDEIVTTEGSGSMSGVEPFHSKDTNSNSIVVGEQIRSYDVVVSTYGTQAPLIDTIKYVWFQDEDTGTERIFTYDFKVVTTIPEDNFTIEPSEPDAIDNQSTRNDFKYSRLVEELITITNIQQMKEIIGFPYL